MQVGVARPAGTAGKCHAARCNSRRSNCYTAFRMSFSRSHAMADVWKGALAGFAATAPMTVAMWALDRSWRPTEQRLPPKQITRKLARRFRLDRLLNESGKEAASWASHFGYGAATGAAYPLTAERIPVRAEVKGPLYGVLVWALSYLGWLPALAILPHAKRQSTWRNIALVGSHVIWGLICALVFGRINPALPSPGTSRATRAVT
jgi:hypothetical protein